MQNKISIIIPVHNGEKYLDLALESVLNQTFKHWECIIIDDESNDKTQEIIEKYTRKDERFLSIRCDKQESLGNVLNIGIENSHCEYIVRMDADDIMSPTRLDHQFSYMENNPDVIICGGQIDLINAKGEVIGHREYSLSDCELKKNIFLFSPFAHPAVIIRKKPLIDVGMYPRDLIKVEDIKLWYLLYKKGEFANISNTVLKYRVRDNSESLSNIYNHFLLTDKLRKEIIKEEILIPDFRQKVLMVIQRIIIRIVRYLPNNLFMKIFELGRMTLK